MHMQCASHALNAMTQGFVGRCKRVRPVRRPVAGPSALLGITLALNWGSWTKYRTVLVFKD